MRSDESDSERAAKLRKLADRTSKACTKCRSQKMRCVGADNPPCQRCRVTKSRCEFVPRANASLRHVVLPRSPGHACTDEWRGDISTRLEDLESRNDALEKMVRDLLRERGDDSFKGSSVAHDSPWEADDTESGDSVEGMLRAITALRGRLSPELSTQAAWDKESVETLWSSFRTKMPGLHFLTGTVSFTDPSPLLAASILVVSSAHHPSRRLASFQPIYFQAFAHAVGAAAIPDLVGEASGQPVAVLGKKFDDVLGIILAGLLAIGWVETVGVWITTGYRMLLDGVASAESVQIREWKGLWEGLRTIELEHSSLHLSLPALPAVPPFYTIDSTLAEKNTDTPASSIGELLQIMQRRMSTFVRRGFTTLWEAVCAAGKVMAQPRPKVTEEDVKAVADWALEIDDWFRRHSIPSASASSFSRTIVLLNYHLHKIFALSILLPPRGVNGVSIAEREALLASSRVALQIESDGFEVWSSWDLVVITNASLILLSSLVAGCGNPEDVHLVQNHLNVLSSTAQSGPSLRHTLHNRLEQALQTVRTPIAPLVPLPVTRKPQEVPPAPVPVNHITQDPANLTLAPAPFVPLNPDGSLDVLAQPSDWISEQTLGLDHAFSLGDTFAGPSASADFEWPPFLLNLFEQTDWANINES